MLFRSGSSGIIGLPSQGSTAPSRKSIPCLLSLLLSLSVCALLFNTEDPASQLSPLLKLPGSQGLSKHRLGSPGVQGDEGINWEIGIDTYPLLTLCIKWVTNENLLYSTGNSTQYSVVT